MPTVAAVVAPSAAPPARPPLAARRAVVYPAVTLLFFGAIAPTLTWLEFSSGLENLNVATALELRRDHDDGDWLIPTLEGMPRVRKPPLAAWVTAHAIRPETVRAMSDPDPRVRSAAVERMAFQARWPSLLAACLMLLAVYELGRAAADPVTGLVAAVVAGTTLMFLRFGRSALIDVHLGLWVTVANAALAHALLHGRRWAGCAVAGVALGLAFLLKGPVAWAQTLLPAAAFAVATTLYDSDRRRASVLPWVGPVGVGLLLMAAVALPWYLYVVRAVPNVVTEVWLKEAVEERGEKPSPAFTYLAILPYLLPWTVAFVGGLIHAAPKSRGMLLAATLAVLPLILMTLYKDRKERYMYPVIGAAAVVAAGGLMALARKREPWTPLDKFGVAQHWVLLVLVGVCLPAVAATPWVKELTTPTGEPWVPRARGAALTVVLGLVIAAAMLARKHWLPAILGATAVVLLSIHALILPGYARTEPGASPMRPLAEAIWQAHPDAEMYNAHHKGKRVSTDLSIYLNRRTRWVSDEALAALRPGERAKVVVMLQESKAAEPSPPDGWRYLHKVRRDNKDWWWAFALPAAGAR
jgi:4-amino-4-deoxy-L-arabinose transferase-like glycosyltransferase